MTTTSGGRFAEALLRERKVQLEVPRVQWLPVSILLVGSACAIWLSIGGFGSAVATENVPQGLSSWSSLELFGLSCPTEGACVAVGDRQDGSRMQPVVVQQRGSTWGDPIALGPQQPSQTWNPLTFVACASSGNCIASADGPGLLFSESHGRWSHNHALPLAISGLATSGGAVFPKATACSSDGECWLILSTLTSRNVSTTTYAIGERDGLWLAPYRLGGPHFRLRGHDHGVFDARISCSSVSCTVVGVQFVYRDHVHFVQTEVSGKWGPATPVSPPASEPAHSFRPGAFVSGSIYCTATATCLLAGSGSGQGGAVEQMVDGRWLAPTESIGIEAPYLQSNLAQVACHTEAICVATGYSNIRGDRVVTFAQVDVNGHWLRPLLMRGLGNTGNGAFVGGAQCPTSSTCDVVGQFGTSNTAGRNLSFEATYSGSKWRYWIVSLSGPPDSTYLNGLSCVGGRCWVIGTVFGKGNMPLEGVVFPLMAPAE